MTPFSGSQSVRLHTHLFYLSFLVSRFFFLLLSLIFRGPNCLESETIARARLIVGLHQDGGMLESCDGGELPILTPGTFHFYVPIFSIFPPFKIITALRASAFTGKPD